MVRKIETPPVETTETAETPPIETTETAETPPTETTPLRATKQRIRRTNDHKAGTWTATIIGTQATTVVLMTKLWPTFADLTRTSRELCFMAVNNKVGDSVAGAETDEERLLGMTAMAESLYNDSATFSSGGGGATLDPAIKVLREYIVADLTESGVKSGDAWKAVRADEYAAYVVLLVAQGVEDDESQAILWENYTSEATKEAARREAERVSKATGNDMLAKLSVLRAVKEAAEAAAKEAAELAAMVKEAAEAAAKEAAEAV